MTSFINFGYFYIGGKQLERPNKIIQERLTQLFILSAKLTDQVKEIYESGTLSRYYDS